MLNDEDYTVNEAAGKMTVKIPFDPPGGTYWLKVQVGGGKHDGVSSLVKVDLAPLILNVDEGVIYTTPVTPAAVDSDDIASVTLTKDGAPVDAYALGTEIAENGHYVLTVTDTAGHTVTKTFTLDI